MYVLHTNESPYHTNNLFACPIKPTNLAPFSLCSEPDEIARFLDLPLDYHDYLHWPRLFLSGVGKLLLQQQATIHMYYINPV